MANKILAAVLSLGAVMNNGGISSAMQGKEKKLNGLQSGRLLDYGKSIFKHSGLGYKDLLYSFLGYKFYTALKNKSNSAANILAFGSNIEAYLEELKHLKCVLTLSSFNVIKARYVSNNLVELYRNYKDRRLAEKFVFIPVAYCVEGMHEVLNKIHNPEEEMKDDGDGIIPLAYFFALGKNDGEGNNNNNNEEIKIKEENDEEENNEKIKIKNVHFDYQKIDVKGKDVAKISNMRERLFRVIFDRLGWLFDNFTDEELVHFGKISDDFFDSSECTWNMFVETFDKLKVLIESLGQVDDAFSIPEQYEGQWGSYVKRLRGFAKLLEKAKEIPPSPTPEPKEEEKIIEN